MAERIPERSNKKGQTQNKEKRHLPYPDFEPLILPLLYPHLPLISFIERNANARTVPVPILVEIIALRGTAHGPAVETRAKFRKSFFL